MASEDLKKATGLRIKEARSALGWTQKELCSKAEMKFPSLRDYELGNSIPGGEAVAALVRVGINANWLLTGAGPMLLADLKPLAPAPTGALDPARLRLALALAEDAVAAATTPMSPDQKADLVMTFYMRLDKKDQ